jgi:hypothetical protein
MVVLGVSCARACALVTHQVPWDGLIRYTRVERKPMSCT